MKSSAIRSRNPRAAFAAIGCLAVVSVLSAISSRAQSPEAAASSSSEAVASLAPAVTRSTNPYADHFPNVVLKTHEGRNVRLYDDLLKDKIVLINFMYATCTER